MRLASRFLLLLSALAVFGGIFSVNAQQARPVVFVAIYERGSAWDESKGVFQQASIPDHRAYLRANMDKLFGAAPFTPTPDDRTVGMIILNVATKEEAQAFVDADPAIQQKVMKTTIRRWHVEGLKGCF